MKTTAKKSLCAILAIGIILSLMPMAAFALDESIVIDLSNSGMQYADKSAPSADWVCNGFEIVLDKTTTYQARLLTRGGVSKVNIINLRCAGSYAAWPQNTATKNKNASFTISKTVPNGSYKVKFQGVTSQYGTDVAIYVNGTYVGDYDCYEPTGTKGLGDEKTLNDVTITGGSAEISFRSRKGHDDAMEFYPHKLTLEPIESAATLSAVESAIPETLEKGESANLSAKAKMSDGIYRYFGYTDSGDVPTTDNIVSVTSSDPTVVSVSNVVFVQKNAATDMTQVIDAQTATYTLTAVADGTADITVTAKVNGETKSKTATVTVGGVSAEPVVIDLSNSGMQLVNNTAPSADWVCNGFEIVLDKTTTYAAQRGVRGGVSSVNILKLRCAGSYAAWPQNTDARNKNASFTISKIVPNGSYKVKFQGVTSQYGSDVAIYINGTYVGDYDCYEPTGAKGLGDEKALNDITITGGSAEISFRSRKGHDDAMEFYPHKLTLEPIESAATLSAVESAIPETLEKGESANLSAKAKMSDGIYRYFGYTNTGDVPTTDNIVSVTSSDSSVVSVSNVVFVQKNAATDMTQVIDAQTATYTLTANKGGTADITVTAIVNGETKTKTVTVTVPSTEPGEEVSGKVNVYVGAEAGGTVSATGCEANEVDEVAFGTEITATATANLDYGFAYWRNTAGTVLSTDESYTFKANGNTSVIAVFDAVENPSAETTTLEFWNGNGGFIEKKTVTKGATFASAKISAPSITGYVFDKWSVEDTDTIDMLTRAVALFKEADTSYTVYVNGSPVMTGKKYGEEVTVTSEKANFSVWKLGGNTVSYDKSYTFYVWGDVYLTDEEGEAEDAIPTVGISNFGGTNFICYNVPTGYTKVEAGLIFSKSGTPTISSFYSKAVAKESKSYGQFTAVPCEDESTARAYLIFKCNDCGETRVIYADIIVG